MYGHVWSRPAAAPLTEVDAVRESVQYGPKRRTFSGAPLSLCDGAGG